MRNLLLVALLVLALPSASAAFQDDLDFGEISYYARIAVGDIPSTSGVEPNNQVNVVEYLAFEHPMLDGETFIQINGEFDTVACSCGGFSRQENTIRVGPEIANGTYTLAVTQALAANDAFTVPLSLFGAGVANDAQINLYLQGKDVHAPVADTTLPGSEGPWTIHTFKGTEARPLPANFYMAIVPAATIVDIPAAEGAGFGYMELAIGILVGILVWFWLVQKGFVQARSRKQTVVKSAHQEAAAAESKSMLEARKRVLMAGLKDLEKAKMAKEMDDLIYDALKAELKREAVITMRAIEAAE